MNADNNSNLSKIDVEIASKVHPELYCDWLCYIRMPKMFIIKLLD